MSLWNRFTRSIKALVGRFISGIEDPRLILEQNIRELNDQIPKMNENITTVRANMRMLEREVERQEEDVQELASKIRAALQADRDELAERYALRFDKARQSLQKSQQQLEQASEAYEKAQQVKEAFMRERKRKIEEAQEALRAHERAQWQAEVADAMEQFEVSGIDQTHDEMIQRLREDTARSEARLDMATDTVDDDTLEIEEEAESLRAAKLVEQFKLEMERDSQKALSEGATAGGDETTTTAEETDSSEESDTGRSGPQ